MRNILFDVLEINIVVTLAIMLLCLFAGKLRKRYGAMWLKVMWIVLMVRLLIPYNFSLPVTEFRLFNVPGFEQEIADNVENGNVQSFQSGDSLQNVSMDSTDFYGQNGNSDSEMSQINSESIDGNTDEMNPENESGGFVQINPENVESGTAGISEETSQAGDVHESDTFRYTDILLYIWLIGIGVSAIYHIVVYLVMRRTYMKDSEPVKNASLQEEIGKLQKKYLGQKRLTVYENKQVQSPLITGILCPKLIIPAYEEGWDMNELELITAHELCHYRKKDLWLKMLMLAVTCFNWFNPTVYTMKKQFYYDMELVCDESVMLGRSKEEKETYAKILMSYAGKNRRNYTFMSGLAAGNKLTKNRIYHIWEDGKKKKGVVVFATILAGFIGIGLFVSCGYKPGEVVKDELHSFRQEEVTCVPEVQIHSFETAKALGQSWEIYGSASGAPATWHIIEIEGIEYFYVEHELNGQMVTELYNYAILGEQYSLANGIRVGDPAEEIFTRYPNMAKIYFQDDYITSPKGCLGWSGATYPHSHMGWDENYEYIDGDYNWTNQFDYAIVGNVVRDNDIEAPLYVALLVKDEFVSAITFYSPTDGPGNFVYDVGGAAGTDENDNMLLHSTQYELEAGVNCQIKLYGKMLNEYNYGIGYVEIIADDNSDYSFTTKTAMSEYWGETTEYAECFNQDGGLIIEDINFDGYADIGLQAQVTAYNMPYIYYVYDAENDKYKYFGDFMCFLQVDAETETCLEQYHAGQTYYDDVWAKDNAGGLYLMKRTITEYNYETQEATETTEYYSLEEVSEPVHEEESYLTRVEDPVYRDLITKMLDSGKFPVQENEWDGNPYDSFYCIADVDKDNREELIINWCGGMVTACYIYDYDRETKEAYIQHIGYNDMVIYDSGYIIEDDSHDQGRSSLDDFWPYSVKKYDQQNDVYEHLVNVAAWTEDCNWFEPEFPEEKDADGDGVVYYNWTAENWDNPTDIMDNAEYEEKYREYTGGNAIAIVWNKIISKEEYEALYPQPEANG